MILLYLDPGSGSFLIQLLIASIAAAGIFIAVSWSKIKRILKKTRSSKQMMMTKMMSSRVLEVSFEVPLKNI